MGLCERVWGGVWGVVCGVWGVVCVVGRGVCGYGMVLDRRGSPPLRFGWLLVFGVWGFQGGGVQGVECLGIHLVSGLWLPVPGSGFRVRAGSGFGSRVPGFGVQGHEATPGKHRGPSRTFRSRVPCSHRRCASWP